MKLNTETLLIGGLIAVAGAFIFKDQLCPVVPIPFICNTAMGGGSEQFVKECAAEAPGGATNEKFMKACLEDAQITGYTSHRNSNYAGYY